MEGGAAVSADNPQEWHMRRRRQRAGGGTDPPVNSVAVGSWPAVSCGVPQVGRGSVGTDEREA